MIESRDFLTPAVERGYSFWTGVPCSFLSPFINSVIGSKNLDYIGAASEGEAVGIAAGANLAGKKTVVICQNSGLGNTVNPLTSLNYPFQIPTLLIFTHRGEPDIKDEPQHELMGKITTDLLDSIKIPWEIFPKNKEAIHKCLDRVEASINATSLSYALVMKKGTVAKCEIPKVTRRIINHERAQKGSFTNEPDKWMGRLDAIKIVKEHFGNSAAFIATTGKMGRELFSLGHLPNNLYVVGSMGCASGIALGLHEATKSPKKIVVLDGDGATLMKMGTLATIGYNQPKNLFHILIDNEAHESTGGQATVSSVIDFAKIASACGYRYSLRADNPRSLESILQNTSSLEGPILIHIKARTGSIPNLGRPTLTPVQVKEQFVNWWSQ